jgi:UDP-N-acetylglucosamine:LPS N-acetylglucosamine transferase
MEEKDLSPEALLNAVLRLKNDRRLLNGMSAASGGLGRLDAADAIYDVVAAGMRK